MNYRGIARAGLHVRENMKAPGPVTAPSNEVMDRIKEMLAG